MSDAPLIYLAAPWKDRELARRVRQQFLDAGIRVNSRWLDFEGDEALAPDVVKRQEALNDIEDVLDADTVVVLNSSYSEGKAVETGMALLLCKGLVLIGEPSNVFHYLNFPRVASVEEAIAVVKNYPWRLTQVRLSKDYSDDARQQIITEA